MPPPLRLKLYAFLFLCAFCLLWGIAYPLFDGLEFTRDYTRVVFLSLFALFFGVVVEGIIAKKVTLVGVCGGIRRNWVCLAFICACSWFSTSREAYNFKVTADEYVLSAEAMTLHFEGRSHAPARMYDLKGVYQSLGGTIDKRPPVFVVALSLIHDVFGYRIGNVFVMNVALTFALFGALFLALRTLINSRAAYFGCVLFTSLPLLYQNASGGGFELLNLLLLLVFLLSADRYFKGPTVERQRLMVVVALLLANTRYESAVFSGCAVLLIVIEWIRSRRLLIDVSIYLLPLVMFTFLLRLKVVELDPVGNWQIEAGRSPFSLDYFYDNVGHALNYFLAFTNTSTASEPLFLLGGLGLAFLLYEMAKGAVSSPFGASARTPLLAVTAVILANFALLLSYHWGQLDAPEVSPLALPVFILFVVGASFLFFEAIRHAKVQRVFWLGVGVYIVLCSIPRGAIAQSSNTNYHVRRADWSLAFFKKLQLESLLIASSDAQRIFLERIPAVPISLLNYRVKEADFHLKLKSYSLYVVQKIAQDPETMRETVSTSDRLHPAFITSVVAERSFLPYELTRISKITGVDPLLVDAKPPVADRREAFTSGPGKDGPSYDEMIKWYSNLP